MRINQNNTNFGQAYTIHAQSLGDARRFCDYMKKKEGSYEVRYPYVEVDNNDGKIVNFIPGEDLRKHRELSDLIAKAVVEKKGWYQETEKEVSDDAFKSLVRNDLKNSIDVYI